MYIIYTHRALVYQNMTILLNVYEQCEPRSDCAAAQPDQSPHWRKIVDPDRTVQRTAGSESTLVAVIARNVW